MEHPINITVLNDTNGVATPTDGIMGIFAKAVAVVGTFSLNRAYLITKLTDLAPLGITPAYDIANSTFVYGQVSEFYAQAQDGALLWLFGIDKATTYTAFAATDSFDALIRYTAIADPANRVKMVGFCYDVPTATQSTTDLLPDALALQVVLQAKITALFNQGYQFSAIIDGAGMSTVITPSGLGTMANKACPSLSMCITSNTGNGVASVGFALGRFARISVGHGMGAVEDGPMVTNSAYLTNSIIVPTTGTLIVGRIYTVTGGTVLYNAILYKADDTFVAITAQTVYVTADTGYVIENATPIGSLAPISITQLGQKQYMFLRTWFGHSGFYWNDGATCDSPTVQLSTQEYNRVANSLSASALFFFIGQMGKNMPLDTKTGAVAQTMLNVLEAEFYNTYINPLKVDAGTGDLSDASLTVTGADFNNTKTLNFNLTIVPTPILGKVNGIVRFTSTL